MYDTFPYGNSKNKVELHPHISELCFSYSGQFSGVWQRFFLAWIKRPTFWFPFMIHIKFPNSIFLPPSLWGNSLLCISHWGIYLLCISFRDNFHLCIFSETFLLYAFLSEAILLYAFLSETILVYAFLAEAFLFYAFLSETILVYAFLFCAFLSDAIIFKTLLSETFLFYAFVSEAFLCIFRLCISLWDISLLCIYFWSISFICNFLNVWVTPTENSEDTETELIGFLVCQFRRYKKTLFAACYSDWEEIHVNVCSVIWSSFAKSCLHTMHRDFCNAVLFALC